MPQVAYITGAGDIRYIGDGMALDSRRFSKTYAVYPRTGGPSRADGYDAVGTRDPA